MLGAGPCGLSTAYYLDKKFKGIVLEKEKNVGGISASENYKKIFFDYGSHRYLPSFKNEPLKLLKKIYKKKLKK